MATLSHVLPVAPGTGSQLPPGLVKAVGFTVGGLALIAVADAAPNLAIGFALVLALGVVLSHGSELQSLAVAFAAATGQPAPQN